MAKVTTAFDMNAKQIAAQYGTTAKKIRELNNLQKGQVVSSGTQVRLGAGVGPSKTAQSLYVDPTPAYSPILDFLKQQEDAAKTRYAENKADIKTIFGALSDVAVKDQARINDQFTKSITQQQMDLAARTAEARTGAAAGVAQAQATGAERGGGPAMATSPVQTAAEEGIARSNEYQTTWEALQNANKQQAIVDTQSRQAGYGQQEIGAVRQLAQNLEDKLLAIGGNTAQVQSDIAKAKIGAVQNVANANYSEIQAKQAAAARAAASAASTAAKAAKPKTYSQDITGITKWAKDNSASASDANKFLKSLSKVEKVAVKNALTSGQAYTTWLSSKDAAGNKYSQYPTAYKNKARLFFTKVYKK